MHAITLRSREAGLAALPVTDTPFRHVSGNGAVARVRAAAGRFPW